MWISKAAGSTRRCEDHRGLIRLWPLRAALLIWYSAVRGKAIESGKKFEKKTVLVFLPSPSVLRCYARMSGGGKQMKSVPACDQRHHPSCMLVTSQLRPSSYILPPPPSLAFVRRVELHLLAVGSWVPNISPPLQLFSSDHRPIFFPPPPPWAFIRRLELRPILFASGWILGFKHIIPSSESTLCWLIFEMCLLWSEIDYMWRVYYQFLAVQKELISVLISFPCMTDLNFFFCELTKCDNIGFHNTH